MSLPDSFVTKFFYHIFNKSMDSMTPFSIEMYIYHFMDLIWFYRSINHKLSYSVFRKASKEVKQQYINNINDPNSFQVEILAFCIMPNHYHFLLKQSFDKGIYSFMNNIINAFTRFYNLTHERKGPLFIPQYKFRLIHTEEQLIHVSRYIHLNPYSSGKVKSIKDLLKYRFSSLNEYLIKERLVNTSFVLNSGFFNKNRYKYQSFISNHADYQKSLEHIKHVKKFK